MDDDAKVGLISPSDHQRLADIHQRVAAARPGPWLVGTTDASHESDIVLYAPTGLAWADGDVAMAPIMDGSFLEQADGDFAAAARADVPWLLDLVNRLQCNIVATKNQSPSIPPGNPIVGIRWIYHLNQPRFAQLIGVSVPSLSSAETGASLLPRAVILGIARLGYDAFALEDAYRRWRETQANQMKADMGKER